MRGGIASCWKRRRCQPTRQIAKQVNTVDASVRVPAIVASRARDHGALNATSTTIAINPGFKYLANARACDQLRAMTYTLITSMPTLIYRFSTCPKLSAPSDGVPFKPQLGGRF